MSLRVLLVVLFLMGSPLAEAIDAEKLFQTHCASCHGVQRLGGIGPALLPGNLTRLRRDDAAEVIASGRPATQMPAFSGKLSQDEVNALVDFVYEPPAVAPHWDKKDIEGSHVVYHALDTLGDKPVFDSDPLNLFVVVETGDHHATILDGDRLEPIHRFRTRFALHGGPKFSPNGRFVYFASRDGWISKFDLYTLQTTAEIRAGINTRNLAVSSDGRYAMAANYLPHTLVLLDAQDLSLIRIFPVEDDTGATSRVSAVYDAPPRESFIAALKDLTEVWEISYADDPPYYGKVHDYRYEGPPETGPFPVRRIALDDYLDDFFFDPKYENIIGAARNAKNGQVVNLLVGRKIAEIGLTGLPHLGSGITWTYNGRPVLATPNLKEGLVSIIDMTDWSTIERIETLGPGFFMRSHENTPYAWVDVFFGPNRDALHVIDKHSLKIVRTLRPSPGKTAAHVEFTADGSHALVSIWEEDGALVVYDAQRLEEVKRIPMTKPSGKYNVHNKITRSEGTSH